MCDGGIGINRRTHHFGEYVSFGEDADGELYIVQRAISGGVFKIVPDLMELLEPSLVAGQSSVLKVERATPGGRVFFLVSQVLRLLRIGSWASYEGLYERSENEID